MRILTNKTEMSKDINEENVASKKIDMNKDSNEEYLSCIVNINDE